jgi:hypothetical protein
VAPCICGFVCQTFVVRFDTSNRVRDVVDNDIYSLISTVLLY